MKLLLLLFPHGSHALVLFDLFYCFLFPHLPFSIVLSCSTFVNFQSFSHWNIMFSFPYSDPLSHNKAIYSPSSHPEICKILNSLFLQFLSINYENFIHEYSVSCILFHHCLLFPFHFCPLFLKNLFYVYYLCFFQSLTRVTYVILSLELTSRVQ